jgi:MFS family permease
VLSDRSLRNLVLSQLLGRSPVATMTIALTVFVNQTYNNIALAGAVLASYTLGACAAGPVTSGLVARFEARATLLALGILWATALSAFAIVVPSSSGVVVLAVVVGFLLPPVGPVVRSLYPRLVPPARVGTLIALDSSLGETMWIFGPVIVSLAQHFWGVRAALVLVALLALVGVILVVTNRSFGAHSRPAAQPAASLSVLRATQFRPLLLGMGGLTAGWGALEIAMVERIHESLLIGALFSVMALFGALSGVVWGRRAVGPGSIALRSCVLVAGTGFALVDVGSWWLPVILSIASMGSVPTMAAIFLRVTQVVPDHQRAVAFGWIATSQLAGMAAGAYAAGQLMGWSGDWRTGIVVSVGMFSITTAAGVALSPACAALRRRTE